MAYVSGGQSVQGQALDITVVGCNNLKNKEWFTKQDPYVVIEYSGQKFRTRTDTDGGKNPSFNETFKIALIEGLREMNATVWNSNTIERHDYIGSTKILLSKVIESGYDDTQWPLTDFRSRKSSGTLKLILHYASAKTKPAQSEGTSYSQAPPAAPPAYYGQAPPAYYGQAPPAYYGQAPPAYAPSYQPAPYPPQGGYYPPPPPQAAAPPYYQAPPPTLYPPAYGAPPPAYGAPPACGAPPPAQPSHYPTVSAPPAYGAAPSAPPYPTYPPAAPSGYPPGGYPHYR